MKSSLILFGLAAGTALADLHKNSNRHAHPNAKRDLDVVEEHVSVTVIQCILDGQAISREDCDEGIKSGRYRWAEDGSLSADTSFTSYYTSRPTPKPAPAAVSTKAAVAANFANAGLATVNRAFPDGEIDCSSFPSDFGAMPINWLGLGGWASVQVPRVDTDAGYNDIMDITHAQCNGQNCCVNGSFCSYACPEGYLKWQWPSKQGATGQSIGGLYCQNGKLRLTNPSQGTLCAPGTNNVNVYVQNKLNQNVAICRTNYPGDEKMSIPVDSQPGTTRKLACPDAGTFYTWQGHGTSAQYYINLPGYSVEKACVWGEEGDNFGNFAPGNLGVGYSGGRAWLSIAPNLPTQPNVRLPYTIELVGDELSDKCRYENGQYCQGENYERCSNTGCTVSAASGNIYYVLS